MTLVINNKDYDAPQEHLVESLGVLPYWVTEAVLFQEDNIEEYLERRYGYPLHKFNGTVADDGTYSSEYEEDPDMPYVGKMQTHKGTVYFYPYAMVAIPANDGTHFVTRMD